LRYFLLAINDREKHDEIARYLRFLNSLLEKKGTETRIGALIRYTSFRTGCSPCRAYKSEGVLLFVDNGAFTYLSKADLDKSLHIGHIKDRWLRDYFRFIKENSDRIDVFALPDVPVHGKHFVEREERARRIEMSARLHKEFYEMLSRKHSEAIGKALAVLQGFELDEYLTSYDMLKRLELKGTLSFPDRSSVQTPFTGVLAVGSVCVRKPSSKGKTAVMADGRVAGSIYEFIEEFLGHPNWDVTISGFHFFGLHVRATRRYKDHVRFHSSDTGGHALNFKLKWRTFLKCEKPDTKCYIKSIARQVSNVLGLSMEEAFEEYFR